MSMVEKIYRITDENTAQKLSDLLLEIHQEHVRIANLIIDYAKQTLDKELSDNIYISITDHISFALERMEKGMPLKNALLWEIKKYYHSEYSLSLIHIQMCIRDRDGDEWIFKGDCQTNLVGAGFHKYAIEFIDAFQERLGKHMLIEDDTEYEGRRDFERMRKDHFYSWLQNIIEICHDYAGGDYSNLSICWDMNQYQPCLLYTSGCTAEAFGTYFTAHQG